jgi:NAD(P)-dependent dehydrogenase (short-subunit alcohol dehydrogenase family)
MPNIILILGAGPNVGLSLATHFSKNGFKTAIVSRNPSAELSAAADLTLKADFQDPKSIKGFFEEVREKLGVPNVVVYNGPSPSLMTMAS